jgi:glycosyltransferase involved in cell wall biosynthesis
LQSVKGNQTGAMSIVIFGDLFTFPEGNAATNRVYTYAKGFIEHGVSTCVICFGNEYFDYNTDTAEGIQYYHPFGQTKRSKYIIIRQWLKLQKYFKTIALINKINSINKITAINVWTNSIETHMFAVLLSFITQSKLLVECSEHPLRNFQGNGLQKIGGHSKLFIESHLCDGILCISQYLVNFYRRHGIADNKLLLVPSTVDLSRFPRDSAKPVPFRYIGYFGSLSMKRDSINVLIKAFSQIAKKHKDIYLVLGGFCSDQEKEQLLQSITGNNLELSVKLLNYLSRQEILGYMQHADILVMMRSNDLEATASYPSKLTEYLATSKPVISVNVGEITDFLKDGENAFIIEPDNEDQLVDKLDYVLNNYENLLGVGKAGRTLTETIFSYKYQTARILNYFHINN